MIVNKYEFRKLNKGEFREASNVFNEFEASKYSNEGIYTFRQG